MHEHHGHDHRHHHEPDGERHDPNCPSEQRCGHLHESAGEPLFGCEGLVVGFGSTALLPAVELTLRHGELCAVIGPNGSGKTTLVRTLLGLQPPLRGRLRTYCEGRCDMAYIPQRSELDPIVPLRARDVVAMGVERGQSFLRPWLPRQDRLRIDHAIAEMEVGHLERRLFRELSEGQKQRVLMARLMASHPELALLDEPTAAMDPVAQRATFELIDKLRRQHGMAVLMVTHHLEPVRERADQVLFLDGDRQVVLVGPPAEVFAHPAFEARYGQVGAPVA